MNVGIVGVFRFSLLLFAAPPFPVGGFSFRVRLVPFLRGWWGFLASGIFDSSDTAGGILLSERQAGASSSVAVAAAQHMPLSTRASWSLDARHDARDAAILGC